MVNTQTHLPLHSVIIPLSPDELSVLIATTVQALLEQNSSALSNDTSQNQPDQLLTVEETRRLLGVSRPTLNDWEKRGILCPGRIGTRVYYQRSTIQEALEKGRIRSNPTNPKR